MTDPILNIIISIRERLTGALYDKGALTGELRVDRELLQLLNQLVTAGLLEDLAVANKKTLFLSKLVLAEVETLDIAMDLRTRKYKKAIYYENMDELLRLKPDSLPAVPYYIHDVRYDSSTGDLPQEVKQYSDIVAFTDLLEKVSDYNNGKNGAEKTLIFFDKRSLALPLHYARENLRALPGLDNLRDELLNANDKERRKVLFKGELSKCLTGVDGILSFGALLNDYDNFYKSYRQSYLLYVEDFSYHDLKAQVENDQLEYTKKIYGTVNDIQAKLIAVPAAFLLILTQFDFTGDHILKNILMLTGAVLFSVLIDILLQNQFGVLAYIETEIGHLKEGLPNREGIKLDLSVFITSFGKLNPLIARQRLFLWFFRVVTWLIPVIFVVLMFVFS